MPEPKRSKRSPLDLQNLRRRAHLTQEALAGELGLSGSIIFTLESGEGNARLSTVLALTSALAGPLKWPPGKVFGALVPDATYADYEGVRRTAAARLEGGGGRWGNLRPKDRFRQGLPGAAEGGVGDVSLYRFQELYARSPFSIMDLVRLTGVSDRRLSFIFGDAARHSSNMTLAVFLPLAAALSPVYKKGVKETALYLLGDDLRRLDEAYAARRQGG